MGGREGGRQEVREVDRKLGMGGRKDVWKGVDR